jgi:hypothetical protein
MGLEMPVNASPFMAARGSREARRWMVCQLLDRVARRDGSHSGRRLHGNSENYCSLPGHMFCFGDRMQDF